MSGVLVNPPCEDETGLISVLDLDLKGDNALGMVLQSYLPVAASTIRRHVHIYAEGEGLESNSYETIKKSVSFPYGGGASNIFSGKLSAGSL